MSAAAAVALATATIVTQPTFKGPPPAGPVGRFAGPPKAGPIGDFHGPAKAGPITESDGTPDAGPGPIGTYRPPGGSYGFSPRMLKLEYEDVYAPLFRLRRRADGRREYAGGDGGATVPCAFPARKAAGVFRLIVLGESVGLRYFGAARCPGGVGPDDLGQSWSRVLGGRTVETISMAVGGADSARVALRAREALRYEPDLLIVLTGNNESPDPGNDPSRLKALAARLLSVSETLRRLAAGARRPERTPEQMLARFRANLEDIARGAAERRVPLVLCTLPRNLADAPPEHVLPLGRATFFRAWRALETGDASRAEKLAAEDIAARDSAFGHYVRGRALRRLGREREALDELEAAVERTQHGVTAARNRAVREAAARWGAAVADLDAAVKAAAPGGLPGSESFDDAVHWNESLNPLLNAVVERAFAGLAPAASGARVDAAALRDEERQAVEASRRRDLDADARRAVLNGLWIWGVKRDEVDETCVASLAGALRWSPRLVARLVTRKPPPGVMSSVGSNWWTSEHSARVTELWPQVLDTVGETYRRAGKPADAARAFRLSLELEPERPLTRLRLALALLALGDRAGARESWEKAAPRAKDFPQLRLYGRELFGLP